MTGKLTWRNETRKLRDLVPWERNPRQTRGEEARRLQESREEFDQPHVFLVGPDDELYDGHQRLETWAQKWGLDLEVDVRVASRPLTEKEREKLTVYLHTGAHGDWDWDALSGWDFEDLSDWGFDADTLAQWNDNAANLALMLEAEEPEDENYSRKIEAPTYEPRGEKPQVEDLFDDSRTRELVEAIDQAEGLSKEEQQFLRIAAQRHTVLNFERIADFYAHSDARVQALMEDSALVIIDFEKAIELGFIELTEKIAKMVRDEYGDD